VRKAASSDGTRRIAERVTDGKQVLCGKYRRRRLWETQSLSRSFPKSQVSQVYSLSASKSLGRVKVASGVGILGINSDDDPGAADHASLLTVLTYYLSYLHTYIPTYLHTYIPTYLHTYIPTYLHTYIPT
jgi:hypothetical protein